MPSCIGPTGLKPLKNVGFQKQEVNYVLEVILTFKCFVHSNLYWSAERSVH